MKYSIQSSYKKSRLNCQWFLLAFSLLLFSNSLFAGVPIATGTAADSTGLTEDDQQIEVLLLGVWHFSNPGLDEYNTEVDNYFSDRRQKEIIEVNTKLAAFKPKKIFIERKSWAQNIVDSIYNAPDFDPKEVPNNRGVSETYQIGFKLGKMLGHQKLYCVDAPGLWLGSTLNKVADEQYKKINDQYNAKFTQLIKEEGDFLNKHTIREGLLRYNTAESLAANHDWYVSFAAQVVDHTKEEDFDFSDEDGMQVTLDEKYIGAELLAEWYRRNIKIYSKILEAVEAGDKKVLVVFGQGHIPILRQLFKDNPKFKIVEVAEVL